MDTNQKLAFISEVMSDAYYSTKMRSLMNAMENGTYSDDFDTAQSAEKILDMMDRFYKLCAYVRKIDYWVNHE